MSSPYMNYIEEDSTLSAALIDCLPRVRELTPSQIETLVFYLKSLYGYYPKSENHVAFCSDFSDRLDKLRNKPEQQALQRKASVEISKGIICCLIAGGLLFVALVIMLGQSFIIAAGAALAAGALILLADAKFFKNALLISKEQDRRYFLASIRESRACNELGWAGLFAYSAEIKSGPRTDQDLERLSLEVASLAASLRAALYNDEYFQYSDPKFSGQATSQT